MDFKFPKKTIKKILFGIFMSRARLSLRRFFSDLSFGFSSPPLLHLKSQPGRARTRRKKSERITKKSLI
jgi:hypothetical protein